MEKNNTDYPNNLYDKIKSNLNNLPEYIKTNLFKYQQVVYDYIINNDSRGLLIIHQTGSGKTITAVSIAEEFRKLKKDILVISPKSLRYNFKKEIITFNKKLNKKITEDEIENKYNFITLGASNMLDQLNIEAKYDKILRKVTEANLENKLLIIDEAHLLFNSIVNGSKIANEFYNLVMNTKNIKILFLTATPITNTPFELVPVLNMCHGYIINPINNKKTTILPEDYGDFYNLYVDEGQNKIKNKEKFQNRLFGLVSYYNKLYFEKQDPFNLQIKKTIKKENFPDKLPLKIETIEMTEYQQLAYDVARSEERLSTFKKIGGFISKNTESSSSSYRIKSRQLSNYYIDTDYIIHSPKMDKIYNNIIKYHNESLNIIYSNFIQAGLIPMSKLLEKNGFINYTTDRKNKENKKFAFFTGDESLSTFDEKEEILKVFTSKENRNGDLIQLLLISSSGAQGIDLKNVRSVHIMEPYWNYSRIEQVEARAIRYKSHIDLDEKDRNVQIYIYISDYNKKLLQEKKNKIKDLINDYKKINKKPSPQELEIEKPTDVSIFMTSIKKPILNNQFIQAISEIAIDCNFYNNKINFDCYSCNSTNKKLYNLDYKSDILLKNPCTEIENIEVEEIIFDGKTYYYDNELNIYQYNEFVNNYNLIINDELLKVLTSNNK